MPLLCKLHNRTGGTVHFIESSSENNTLARAIELLKKKLSGLDETKAGTTYRGVPEVKDEGKEAKAEWLRKF